MNYHITISLCDSVMFARIMVRDIMAMLWVHMLWVHMLWVSHAMGAHVVSASCYGCSCCERSVCVFCVFRFPPSLSSPLTNPRPGPGVVAAVPRRRARTPPRSQTCLLPPVTLRLRHCTLSAVPPHLVEVVTY